MGRIPSSILSEWKQPQQQPQQQQQHLQQQQQHEIKSSRLSSSFIYGGAATTAEIWPPRLYSCSFCRREFRSAQALGGHMNVHRRDRALLRRRSPPPPSLEEDNSSNSNSLQTNIPQPSKRSDLPFHISTTNSANLPLMESFFLTQPQSKNPLSAMQVERSSNYYSSCRRSYLHSFRSNPYTKDSSLPSNHIQTEEALHSSPGNLRLSHSDSNNNTFHPSNKALCSNYFEPVNSPQALPNELDLELRLGYSDLQSFSKTPP